MTAVRPPLALRALLVLSLSMCALTLGYAGHYTKGWAEARAFKPASQQRYALPGVPWFKRPFIEFVHRLQRTIPEGSKVLLEPSRGAEESGKARWFLFLNYYAYPLEFYVRKPQWASGTLVDYPKWLQHHYVTLARNSSVAMSELIEIDDREIEWKVRFPVSLSFQVDDVEIYNKVGSQWVPVPLAGQSPGSKRRDAEAEAAEAGGLSLGIDDGGGQ